MHVSVLLKEAIDGLAVRNGGTYVDATFGAGGHTRAILERLGPQGRVVAFDMDASVLARADLPGDSRLLLIHANFRTLETELAGRAIAPIDGVLFDLGVSSMQFDVGERGFSLSASASDAALDMRMNQSEGFTAAEYIERTSETELADVIFNFGEERHARRIARIIKQNNPKTTGELARIVSGAVHRPGKRERIHPATRTFQALRIAVNDELSALEEGLDAATSVLRPGGRLVAIAFHSLED
ncbi:MAG: 16S rRNA (cytosine(1402)-N(4))-methyltransferase RsmH, partial [Vulcanimicrobiaceae bacterium]